MALLFLVTLLAAGLFCADLVLSTGPDRETFVEVAPGMSSRQIAALLASRGIVRDRYSFDLWHWVRGGTLKAGEYRFEHRAALPAVYSRVERGDVYTRSVTIPESFNIFDIAQAIQNAQLGSKEGFLAAAKANVGLIADLDPGAPSLEGYLFPDTYRFERRDTPAQMLLVMVKRFRKASSSIGLDGNYHRVVTLASLIERETPVAEDRPVVASVFENRLGKGMPLMTDPTVIYAALLQQRYRGTIYRSDLAADSSYNTYLHRGLPPGPICNPGLASLEAAMHPAKTNFLYFVADPGASGHSRFSSTLEEHERNVSVYRQELKAAQGGR